MARRVWIIAKKDKIEDSDIADASLNGCPEIANGIPPALEGLIGALPCVYEEPAIPEPIPPRDLATEVDSLTATVNQITEKVFSPAPFEEPDIPGLAGRVDYIEAFLKGLYP